MKKIIPLLIIFGWALSACSPTKNLDEFYSKYDKRATVIPLPSFAVNLAKKKTDAKILEYVKSAKVFVISNAGKGKQNRVIKDLLSATKGENFEQMVKLKVKRNNLSASYLENEGKINKLILGVNGLSNVLVIDSKVDLTKDELERALEDIDLSDLEELTDILK
ncbi:DUF4252 domain-containing protein [Faecalibacter sp. LW9]|uniref:DUF4252 domain-containing protein n=1 Tax=Faecalibacter sp. LW9 TaxID=3103144 RepID=UPI002AFE0B8B|nr:DUF4252 domain-containing protein [Faecalibacter sp. LW9]